MATDQAGGTVTEAQITLMIPMTPDRRMDGKIRGVGERDCNRPSRGRLTDKVKRRCQYIVRFHSPKTCQRGNGVLANSAVRCLLPVSRRTENSAPERVPTQTKIEPNVALDSGRNLLTTRANGRIVAFASVHPAGNSGPLKQKPIIGSIAPTDAPTMPGASLRQSGASFAGTTFLAGQRPCVFALAVAPLAHMPVNRSTPKTYGSIRSTSNA